MNRIYIVNNSGHRYELALKTIPNAELIDLTRGGVNPTQADRISFNLAQKIAGSNEDDFLLLSGTPTLNAIAAMIWILRHPHINLLIFDAKEQEYNRQILSRSNLQGIIDDAIVGS